MQHEWLVNINGEYYPKSEAKISVYDHGFLYGDGVFEGIRAYNGIVFQLKEHVDRLYASAHAISIAIPVAKNQMIEIILETLRKNNLKDAYIRVLVSRGIGDLGVDPKKCDKASIVIITEPLPATFGSSGVEKGIRVMISSTRRDAPTATTHEIKSMNYLNSILALLEAHASKMDDAIMLDARGFVSEGTTANLFAAKNGRIMTPPTSASILHGITRQRIMKLAKDLDIPVDERDMTVFELLTSQEVFLTGTKAELVPVVEINGRKIGEGIPGPVTKRVHEEFHKLTKDVREGIPIYSRGKE